MSDRIGIRELRKGLKGYLEGKTPVVVGTNWRIRAIVVPVTRGDRYSWGEQYVELRAARRQFLELIRSLLPARQKRKR